jgi:hypothetical protein
MAEITGYETGTPRTCPWCWEKTTAIGVDEFTGATIPLHVTCAMQMLLIRKRMQGPGRVRHSSGVRPSVAWRRFFRMQRTARRVAKSMKRLDGHRRLMLPFGDGNRIDGPNLHRS